MEIRAMDLIDKEDQDKRVKIVTRFLIEPNADTGFGKFDLFRESSRSASAYPFYGLCQ